ncbi:hypothetical protein P9112_011349 [Eukaryota sp. TZLM1-RC]
MLQKLVSGELLVLNRRCIAFWTKNKPPSITEDCVRHLVSKWLSFYDFRHSASIFEAEAALQDIFSKNDFISTYSLKKSPSEPLLLTLFSSFDAVGTAPPPESTPTEVKEILSSSQSPAKIPTQNMYAQFPHLSSIPSLPLLFCLW